MPTKHAGQPGSDCQKGGARTFFEDPQVMELVSAFASIADETTRRSVLSIVKTAADLQRERTAPPAPDNID